MSESSTPDPPATSDESTATAPPPAARRVLLVDLTPLRISRDYRLLFTGQFVSIFGTAVSYVVLPWQIYQLTKSSFAVGMLGLAEFVPMFLMGFVGGTLADYVDRRRLILLTEVGLIVSVAVLIFNSLREQPQVWLIFLVAALLAALSGLQRPALEALTPQILPPEQMPAVAALMMLRGNFGHIVGPALAGVLVASFGAAVAYTIDLATYLVSLVSLMIMRTIPKPEQPEALNLNSLTEGWRYARSRQDLLGTYLIDLNAMFFGMPMALFPAMAESFGNASVGLFYAMPSAGALLAALASGWADRIHKHGLVITAAATLWGLAIIGFGLANSLWLALLFLALAGAADSVSGIFRLTIWNQTIPTHLRGRLAGIEMISYSTGPYLGNAEAGLVASLFGLRTSVVSGGILCVIGSGVLALLLPQFIRYDSRAGLARRRAEEVLRKSNCHAPRRNRNAE